MNQNISALAPLLCALIGACDGSTPEPAPQASSVTKTPVLLFAASKADAISGNGMTPVGPELTSAGYHVVSFDLPCHGADATDEPPLNCWATRIKGGDKVFPAFCAQVSDAITQLGVGSIAAVGISRGGYIAIRCAALDSRISALGLIAPVTDLQRLEEFNGFKVDQSIYGVFQYRAMLSSRPTLLRMHRTDPRVGTDSALAFLQGFVYLTTEIIDGSGHGIPESTETATWLRGL